MSIVYYKKQYLKHGYSGTTLYVLWNQDGKPIMVSEKPLKLKSGEQRRVNSDLWKLKRHASMTGKELIEMECRTIRLESDVLVCKDTDIVEE